MPAPGARIRIVEDDVQIVRYSELLERVVEHGQGAEMVATSLGLSPAAIIFHLNKMGLRYNRRERRWEDR